MMHTHPRHRRIVSNKVNRVAEGKFIMSKDAIDELNATLLTNLPSKVSQHLTIFSSREKNDWSIVRIIDMMDTLFCGIKHVDAHWLFISAHSFSSGYSELNNSQKF
jgi:hypothetical protein